MLQTRLGKRTAKAALRIAVEFANEGLITRKEAVTRIDPGALDQLLHPTIDPNAERKIICLTGTSFCAISRAHHAGRPPPAGNGR